VVSFGGPGFDSQRFQELFRFLDALEINRQQHCFEGGQCRKSLISW